MSQYSPRILPTDSPYECVMDLVLPDRPEHKVAVIDALAEGLVLANMALLLEHPELPRLESAGVKYGKSDAWASWQCRGNRCEAPEKVDRWKAIPSLYGSRRGAGKDLVAAWVAERRLFFGEPWRCKALVYPGRGPKGSDLFQLVAQNFQTGQQIDVVQGFSDALQLRNTNGFFSDSVPGKPYKCVLDFELPRDPKRKIEVIDALTEALALTDLGLRLESPGRYPLIEDSAVRYARAYAFASWKCDGEICSVPQKVDRWKATPILFEAGEGDCKELIADFIAGRRVLGEQGWRPMGLFYEGAGSRGEDLFHEIAYNERTRQQRDISREKGMGLDAPA